MPYVRTLLFGTYAWATTPSDLGLIQPTYPHSWAKVLKHICLLPDGSAGWPKPGTPGRGWFSGRALYQPPPID